MAKEKVKPSGKSTMASEVVKNVLPDPMKSGGKKTVKK